jgi:hypothetical protein
MGFSVGAKAGIAIGSVAGVCIIVLLAYVAILTRRRDSGRDAAGGEVGRHKMSKLDRAWRMGWNLRRKWGSERLERSFRCIWHLKTREGGQN